MKKVLVIMVVLFSVLSVQAQISKASLTASGLTCSMCSKAIYEALKKVDFVENVKSDIKNSVYYLQFKENGNVNLDVIKKAVEGAGFSVAKLQITVNFADTKVENDTHIAISGQNLHFINVGSKTLNGETVLSLLDKNFTSSKEHKKFAQYTKMKCYSTGVMQSCCTNDVKIGDRIYHVTI